MSKVNLYKGFEVELFTGSLNSHIGVSAEIEKEFSNFVKEPDNRNVEYITTPEKDYKSLYEKLITPRKDLRQWLNKKGLTIIPSSTLCFKHDIKFQRSEAALYLSISASSPFLNNKITENHSQRWIQFPKTPKNVPFFVNHNSYIDWIEQNIANKKMQNIRHFWSSIRPNGPKRPLILDRLELRICDFVHDINLLLGITAMLELRILNLFENINTLDPLTASIFSVDELPDICDQNELYAAKDSLNSELIHWQDGKKVICREWIHNLLSDLSSTAEKFNMQHLLKPIYTVLDEGNQSMKWINQYEKGISIEQIMKISIDDMIKNEDVSI